jgi:Flp pilus assembly protein TadB
LPMGVKERISCRDEMRKIKEDFSRDSKKLKDDYKREAVGDLKKGFKKAQDDLKEDFKSMKTNLKDTPATKEPPNKTPTKRKPQKNGFIVMLEALWLMVLSAPIFVIGILVLIFAVFMGWELIKSIF